MDKACELGKIRLHIDKRGGNWEYQLRTEGRPGGDPGKLLGTTNTFIEAQGYEIGRRVVACWNRLIDSTTESLESGLDSQEAEMAKRYSERLTLALHILRASPEWSKLSSVLLTAPDGEPIKTVGQLIGEALSDKNDGKLALLRPGGVAAR